MQVIYNSLIALYFTVNTSLSIQAQQFIVKVQENIFFISSAVWLLAESHLNMDTLANYYMNLACVYSWHILSLYVAKYKSSLKLKCLLANSTFFLNLSLKQISRKLA